MKKIFLFIYFISLQGISQTNTYVLDLSEHPKRFTLSQRINETSGIEFYYNYLYTFNDSGGKPEIYKLDSKNGEILQTIKISGAQNKDWEEIALKNDTLFIGDFGNNLGNRRDLTIYSILLPKEKGIDETETTIIDKFQFIFEDQTDFENTEYMKTNFDCEAFIYYQGKLHLFTKRWGDNHTTHYEIELDDTDLRIARKIETFNAECLITGADIFQNELYMIGYDQEGLAYIWKFTDTSQGKFFNGKAEKILIGFTASIGQMEGIAVTEDKIYITGEEMKYSLFYAPPSLYIIDKNDFNPKKLLPE